MSTDHRRLYVILFAFLALLLIGPFVMGSMMGPGFMMGPGGMWRPGPGGMQPGAPGWMWGLGLGFRWLTMAAFWGALIVGLVLTVRWISGTAPDTSTPESPRGILKRRYALGEIDQPTFERMMHEVE